MTLLNDAVREAVRRSMLCWLATVDARGQPHVSPQEVWAIPDGQHVVITHITHITHITSPVSARNIALWA